MTFLWMFLGFAAIVFITAVMSMYWGRGHLVVEQSLNHYLDEAAVNAPVPGGYVTRRNYD